MPRGLVCPHCRGTDQVETHAALNFRCRACGGARILGVDDRLVAPDLERAHRAHRLWWILRAIFLAVSIPAGLFLMTTLALLAFIQPTLGWWVFWLALSVSPNLLALGLWRASGKAKERRQAALEEAWSRQVAQLVTSTSGGVTARSLADRLSVSEEQTEKILSRLSVEDRVRSEVTDEGDIVYTPTAGSRLRVEDIGSEEPFLEAQADPRKRHYRQR